MTGLTANTYYTLRARSLNEHGWSATWNPLYTEVVQEWDESSYFTVITAIKPDQPAQVTTSLVNLNIRIDWLHPFNNYQDIEKYEIQIQDSTGTTFTSNTQYCDGDLFTQAKTDA